MKYYSEKLNKVFDEVEDLKLAEEEYDKKIQEIEAKKAARQTRATEVDAAFKKMVEAREEYNKLLAQFVADYGSYHKTYTNQDVKNMEDASNKQLINLTDLVNNMINNFWF